MAVLLHSFTCFTWEDSGRPRDKRKHSRARPRPACPRGRAFDVLSRLTLDAVALLDALRFARNVPADRDVSWL